MISGQPGDLLVLLAFAMVVLSGGAFLSAALGRTSLVSLGRRAYAAQLVLTVLASGYLFYLFFSHDFSIEYVYSYSSTDLPFFYLLSSFWAGQEGTYLLWFLFSGLFGLILYRRAGIYRDWSMFFYSLINMFLGLMTLIVSPFASFGFPVEEGAGLNPLLQDFWMVIHPPVMFCAYAMAGLPFAIALAAMMKRDFSRWIKTAFPLVALTACLLLAANAMGGYWAYKTLGWGGYWAWDPVENTSFVPWMIALALVHGMLIERRSGALRRVNLLLAAFTFFLVVYGTFLTRSGVLADFSVHSFVDLGANAILISFVLASLLLTLVVFAWRHRPEMIGRPLNYNIFGREFILFVGLVLLFVLGVLVMFWSSLPFITQSLSDNPAAAEIATYNAFAFPLAIIMSLFVTLGTLKFRSGETNDPGKRRGLITLLVALALGSAMYVLAGVAFAVAVTAFLYFWAMMIYLEVGEIRTDLIIALAVGTVAVIIALLAGVRSAAYLLFFGAAAAAVGAHLRPLAGMFRGRLYQAGAPLAHLGIGLMLIGILGSSAFSVDRRLVLPRHETGDAFGYSVMYEGLAGSIMQANNEILLKLRRGDGVSDARPQFFYTPRMDGIMKRPYIRTELFRDLYLAPLDVQELAGGDGLHLVRGDSRTVAPYDFKFIDFAMVDSDTGSGIRVQTEIEVTRLGRVDTLRPVVTSTPGGLVGDPVALPDSDYELRVISIRAGRGEVVLEIPGLIETGAPDQLILEVSVKPVINLVWLGVIIAGIGLVLSFRRGFNSTPDH